MSELFIEVRCEELPARFVSPAIEGLVTGVRKLLTGLEFGELRVWATPRRIAVAVTDLAAEKAITETLVTGPPERAAFRDGAPTKAAIGFARGRGVSVEDLQIVDGPKGRVIAALVRSGGEKAAELIRDGLEDAVLRIHFPKTMRWGAGSPRWARPIHGVIALLDGQIIDTSVAGVRTSASTLGHRLTPGPITITGADQWLADLREHHVEPDLETRRARIVAGVQEAAEAIGADVTPALDLVDEVQHLVEHPVVVTAEFGEELLQLPPRLLEESMKVHQRVFPLWRDGALVNQFLVVTNHPYAHDPEVARVIGSGNVKVLAARFHDARFFYAEDRKQPLAKHRDVLSGMQWIRKGGTMLEKANRVSALAEILAPAVGADGAIAARAGALSKADLATQMVGEFPELQGHVGNLLAGHDGEADGVGLAIEEHYLPRFAGDALPTSPAGLAAALADRLDTLVGCFANGLKPKGSADPLGLRRAANGLLLLMRAANLQWKLGDLIDRSPTAARMSSDVRDALVGFILARLRAQLQEHNATDLVDAVLATGDTDPVALAARVDAMAALAAGPEFGPLKTTFKRVANITKDHASEAFDASALPTDADQALASAYAAVAAQAAADARALDYTGALNRLAGLKPHVDALFDAVMVNDPDADVRAARLGLLRAITAGFEQIADFKRLHADG